MNLENAMKYYWIMYALVWLHILVGIWAFLSTGGTVENLFGEDGPTFFAFIIIFPLDIYAIGIGIVLIIEDW